MNKKIIALLAATVILSACAESRLNPFNWFRRAQPEPQVVVMEQVNGRPAVVDGRVLIQRVAELHVDRRAGGAIIRAMGLPPTQGWFEARLVPVNNEIPVDGVLTYEFRVTEPLTPQPIGTQRSREIYVARNVSDYTLAGVRRIRVIGATNILTSRR